MITTLSSKGQTIIPKSIRETLGLRPGARFHIQIEKDRIILEPVAASAIESLFGKLAETDFLAELEAEHRQEVEDEATLRL